MTATTSTASTPPYAAARADSSLLRPSVIFGAEDRFLNLFAALQAVFPLVPLAGAASRYQPVWVEERAIVKVPLPVPLLVSRCW